MPNPRQIVKHYVRPGSTPVRSAILVRSDAARRFTARVSCPYRPTESPNHGQSAPAARNTGTVVLLMGGTPLLRIAGGPAPALWHSSPLDSNIVEEQDDVAADGINGWTLTTAEATFTASGGP